MGVQVPRSPQKERKIMKQVELELNGYKPYELKFSSKKDLVTTKFVEINSKVKVELNEVYDTLTQVISGDSIVYGYPLGDILKEIGVLKTLGCSSWFLGAQQGPKFDEFFDKIAEEFDKEEIEIPEFREFPKIARLSRECIITEKIDGTNGQICIVPLPENYKPFDGVYVDCDMMLFAGSKSRWLTRKEDNHGFCNWAFDHGTELISYLGQGRHFGEWWGQGIQRNYGLKEKRFNLFNVQRWCLYGETPKEIPTEDPRITKIQKVLPPCCGLVPVLYNGIFDTTIVDNCLKELKNNGSSAVPGFMKPEGVVVYHIAANIGFKKTIEKDEVPKGKVKSHVV